MAWNMPSTTLWQALITLTGFLIVPTNVDGCVLSLTHCTRDNNWACCWRQQALHIRFLGSTVKYVQSNKAKEPQDEDWRAGGTLAEMKRGFTGERKKGR